MGLQTATCDRPLAPDTRTPGGAPEWVHLLPDGQMTGRDGRVFDLVDPGALVLEFQSGGVDLAIDYEHATEKPELKTGGPVPAAGWIKELKADETGLWGRVEWTALASQMIADREYRYLSPAFMFNPITRAIAKLKGAGLTHTPNLPLVALNSQDAAMPATAAPAEPPALASLIAFLGLEPEAKPVAVLRAVLDLLKFGEKAPDESALMSELLVSTAPDPAQFVPVAAVQAMLAERNLHLATAAEERAQTKVADAFRRGYLTGPMRDWALALCRSDEPAFDTFLAASVPAFGHLLTNPRPPGTPAGSAPGAWPATDVETALCAQLGLPPGSLSR